MKKCDADNFTRKSKFLRQKWIYLQKINRSVFNESICKKWFDPEETRKLTSEIKAQNTTILSWILMMHLMCARAYASVLMFERYTRLWLWHLTVSLLLRLCFLVVVISCVYACACTRSFVWAKIYYLLLFVIDVSSASQLSPWKPLPSSSRTCCCARAWWRDLCLLKSIARTVQYPAWYLSAIIICSMSWLMHFVKHITESVWHAIQSVILHDAPQNQSLTVMYQPLI